MILFYKRRRMPTQAIYRTRTDRSNSDILNALKQAKSLFASYLRIRSLASSTSSPELSQARKELESTVKDLSVDLQDLIDSVKAVEGDPFRYGLDIDEVGRRRGLVKDTGDEIENMRQELARNVAGPQSGAQNLNGSLPPPSAFDTDDPDQDDYGAFEQQRQLEMMHEQDDQLDGVFKTVGNLRQQADDMGRELEEQAEMLDDVDKDADRVQGKLQTGLKKVGEVIRKNEGRLSNGRNIKPRALKHALIAKYRNLVKLLHRTSDTRACHTSDNSHHCLTCCSPTPGAFGRNISSFVAQRGDCRLSHSYGRFLYCRLDTAIFSDIYPAGKALGKRWVGRLIRVVDSDVLDAVGKPKSSAHAQL